MVNYEALDMLSCIGKRAIEIRQCLNSDRKHDILSHEEHEIIDTCLYKIGCIAGEAKRKFNNGLEQSKVTQK